MTPVDLKLALEAGTAGLTLLSQFSELMKEADRNNSPVKEMAELIAYFPGEAFSLSKELLRHCEMLKQTFIAEGVDLTKTIAELEADHTWFFTGKYKLVKNFLPYVNGMSNIISHNIDDFIAVARCQDKIHLVSEGFANAKEQKDEIEKIIRRDIPVGAVLDAMIGWSSDIKDEVQKIV
ncbi:hypothetical protein ACOJCM_10065 [Billgrantia sp. LNSP4103-1]|uniref:hypothetical protein n=1 Tax=Billgrantia sp. LNSP4103-1 TaxID=3410266 RepID=UPI00403F3D67